MNAPNAKEKGKLDKQSWERAVAEDKQLSPLARMRRAVAALDAHAIEIAATTTTAVEAENAFEADTDIARWRVSQKLIVARTSSNIERIRREAQRVKARQQAAEARRQAEEGLLNPSEEKSDENNDPPTEAG
jgi:hypothetical protein